MRTTGTSWVVAALLLAMSAVRAETVPEWLWADDFTPRPGSRVAVSLRSGAAPENVRYVTRRGRRTLGQGAFHVEGAGTHLLAWIDPAAGRYAKLILVAGEAPLDDPLRWSELGHRLEIVPQSDPVRLLASGGSLEIQLLFEREPLADAWVTAVGPEGEPQRRRSDEIGLARFRLDRPGAWRLHAERQGVVATLVLAAGLRP